MATDDDNAPGVIAFRLTAIERQMGELRAENKEMRTAMSAGFAGLSFVTREVYDANRATDREAVAEVRRIAEDARKVAWANALLLLTAVSILLAVIKSVAG